VIPEEYQEAFGELNLLCVLKNQPLVERLGELAKQDIATPENNELLRFTWLPWRQFQAEMKRAGYSVSRFAFWEYRNKGMIDETFVRHDGQSTLYQLEGILGYFRGNGKVSGAPDKRVRVKV
jgi:hypothetical protein